MKINIFIFILAILFLVITSSCSTAYSSETVPKTSTSSPDSIQGSYNQARDKWKGKKIVNYDITVDVFSSLLPPPCQMRTVLQVRDGKLFSVQELVTPVPIQSSENQLVRNPECSDYERYLVVNEFEFVEAILDNRLPYKITTIEFDPDYGYISHLTIEKGEAYKEILFTDFNVKK
jgi:Family of unknown function (DUF6174)